jgi:predicted ATP-grasp superfamily ATP-dependent carboligase
VPRVLVTGADQHQGLAVIRGLGRAGYHVIAAGDSPSSIGFYSRYTSDRVVYRSPSLDPPGFGFDILAGIERTQASVIMPAVESTLAALSAMREEVERRALLAAAPAAALPYALDKREAVALASALGIPVPRSVSADTADELLDRAADLPGPFVVKPRGHGGDLRLPHAIDFKVRYADDLNALQRLLATLGRHADKVVVQQYAAGVGRCVAGVWQRGRPVALMAYEREREYPVTGGVGVVRRSIRLDDVIESHATKLLKAAAWHGVAMVEFKYDRRSDAYTFMEINGRFQASTALALDAGLNLPAIAVAIHLDESAPVAASARIGVIERWMRGDLKALWSAIRRTDSDDCPVRKPTFAVLGAFLRDFARTRHYDELAADDWVPALAELLSLAAEGARKVFGVFSSIARFAMSRSRFDSRRRRGVAEAPAAATRGAPFRARPIEAASAVTQRSMRA